MYEKLSDNHLDIYSKIFFYKDDSLKVFIINTNNLFLSINTLYP